jgi:hypothetical protein
MISPGVRSDHGLQRCYRSVSSQNTNKLWPAYSKIGSTPSASVHSPYGSTSLTALEAATGDVEAVTYTVVSFTST